MNIYDVLTLAVPTRALGTIAPSPSRSISFSFWCSFRQKSYPIIVVRPKPRGLHPLSPQLGNPRSVTARQSHSRSNSGSGLGDKQITDWRSNYDKTTRIYPRIFYTPYSMNKLTLHNKDKLTLRHFSFLKTPEVGIIGILCNFNWK